MFLLVDLLLGFGSLSSSIPLLELFLVVHFEQGLVYVLVIAVFTSSSALITGLLACALGTCEFLLDLLLEIVVHYKLSAASLLHQPRRSLLVSVSPMVVLFSLSRLLDDRPQQLEVLVLHIQHLDIAHFFIEYGAQCLEVPFIVRCKQG